MFKTSLVISLFVLPLVILFAVTKDSWNWKKGLKRIIFWGPGVVILVVCGLFVYDKISKMPKKQTTYMGVRLNDTVRDVKLKIGEPVRLDSPSNKNNYYLYYKYQFDDGLPKHIVLGINGSNIYSIQCSDYLTYYVSCNRLVGVSIGDNSDKIIATLGNKYVMIKSRDNINSYYYYNQFNVYYYLEKDKIKAMGIYDSKYGEPQFPH
jgi:hypothetical protein